MLQGPQKYPDRNDIMSTLRSQEALTLEGRAKAIPVPKAKCEATGKAKAKAKVKAKAKAEPAVPKEKAAPKRGKNS